MTDTIYCYPPDYKILKNKLNIQSQDDLNRKERQFATFRITQGCPTGDFDLAHLQAIHHHIFQDIYTWAGEIRQVEISKSHQFMFRQYIASGMHDVHKRIKQQHYFQGMKPNQFAKEAGTIIGDVNYVHPFREGNGRTQLQYLEQLADKAGHPIDLMRLNPKEWIQASINANDGDYTLMEKCIFNALSD